MHFGALQYSSLHYTTEREIPHLQIDAKRRVSRELYKRKHRHIPLPLHPPPSFQRDKEKGAVIFLDNFSAFLLSTHEHPLLHTANGSNENASFFQLPQDMARDVGSTRGEENAIIRGALLPSSAPIACMNRDGGIVAKFRQGARGAHGKLRNDFDTGDHA